MKRYIKADIIDIDDEDYDDQIIIARNPRTSPRTLARLAEDSFLMRHVAANPSTPLEVLQKLANNAKYGDVHLLDSLALNPSASIGVLESIYPKCDWYTLQKIVKHPNADYYLLKDVSKSENCTKEIRKMIKERLKTMPKET